MFGRLSRREKRSPRFLVLGLDCASPELVFDTFNDALPTLRRLMQTGTWGQLESSIPCITVPAWASMMSSRDPGELGCYGFRNRADFSYAEMRTADSNTIQLPRVWDLLSEAGQQCITIGVPQTYPVKPLNGHAVSCFLTPGTDSQFTYPAMFKREVLQYWPQYQFDVREFRTDDKIRLHQQILDMTEMQMGLVEHTMRTKPWDFFMYVNIGVDRLHHGLWRFHDPTHRLHDPNHPLRNAIRDYYIMMDRFAARLLEIAGEDTTVLVVSDHGVSRMDGGVCINEWLWRRGWLHFKTAPPAHRITRIEDMEIDWSRTRAWASGGYYARIFLNIQGREPQGTIAPGAARMVRDELAEQLTAIPGFDGAPLPNTQVFKPDQIYREVNGIPPDLMVYFGDLHWRAVGSLGHGDHLTLDNDTGPDDANHATHGLFILNEPGKPGAGRVDGHQLMDIAPTILDRMGARIPLNMQGRVIFEAQGTKQHRDYRG